LRAAIRIETDERLEDGGRQLQREGDQAYLAEIKMEGVLEKRIDRGDQRLQRVVQEMAETDGEKNLEDGLLAGVCRSSCSNCGQVCVASHLEPESLDLWRWATLLLPHRRGEAARDVVGDVGVEEIVEAIADGTGAGILLPAISPTLMRLRFVEEIKTSSAE